MIIKIENTSLQWASRMTFKRKISIYNFTTQQKSYDFCLSWSMSILFDNYINRKDEMARLILKKTKTVSIFTNLRDTFLVLIYLQEVLT
jgi:hypothetical protein